MEVGNELIIGPCFDDNVIFVGLGVAPDLPLEAFVNGLLLGGTCVLEAKHYGVVAVRPKGRDE